MNSIEASKAVMDQLKNPALRVKILLPGAKLPIRGSEEAAGLDLYAAEDRELPPGAVVAIRTGIAIELPKGTVGLIRDRSGMASRGVTTRVKQSVPGTWAEWARQLDEPEAYVQVSLGGVIDSDFRGELRVILANLSQESQHVRLGERCAQLLVLHSVFAKPIDVEEIGSLSETIRGEGGLGSTGK